MKIDGTLSRHHRHHHAGQRLVAAGDADEGVIAMTAHRQLDGVGDDFARRQRGVHTAMTHGDAVGHGDGAELARGAAGGGDALLDGLRLAHQRDVAGRGFVPAGGDADEGLVDLPGRQTHRVIIRAVRRPLWTFGNVTARQLGLQVGLASIIGVHANVHATAARLQTFRPGVAAGTGTRWLRRASMSWKGMAKSRRAVTLRGRFEMI